MASGRSLCVLLFVGLLVSLAGADLTEQIEKAIQPIVEQMAAKYNCSVSVALQKSHPSDGFSAKVAAGVIDGAVNGAGSTPTTPDDKFVWGSVTKVLTGTGILRLVSEGKLRLDDSVPQYIDPFMKQMKAKNPAQNFSCIADLFGPDVSEIKVVDLLGMKSGLPDYDTASPTGRQPTDVFRLAAYRHPSKDWGPAEMLNLPWVNIGRMLFKPGVCDVEKYHNCYTSTNFVMLGMILAHHAGADNWDTFDQNTILDGVMKPGSLSFALHGPPTKWTTVHGYDTTDYNAQTKTFDVSGVSGVFAGWTAADVVGPASAIANLAYDVYAPPYKLVKQELVEMMYSTSGRTGYGLATFNLTHRTGQSGPDGVAMGHLGATYGYQSIVAYNPAMDFSLAVATNIERDGQDQPADTMCLVYNAVRAIIRGLPTPKCTFTKGYYSGGCHCE